AVVLWRPGKGRWIPVDGNNRLAAYVKNKRKYTDAYVIENNDLQVIDRICWMFNNHVNGKRLSQEDCLEHAISYVLQYGYAVGKAAEEWGVPKWQVQRGQQVARLKDKIRSKDIKITQQLTDDKIHALSPLERAGEDLFIAAAKVVSSTGVSQDLCNTLCREV